MVSDNFALLKAIRERGLSQQKLVRLAGMKSETRLSRIVRGHDLPTEAEVVSLSKALEKSPDELGFLATQEDLMEDEVRDYA